MIKKIIEKMKKTCACCGKTTRVILYEDKTYRGGHYFGKINLGEAKNLEYWECPKCYWGKDRKKSFTVIK